MNDKLALDIVDKIFNNVFDTDNNYSLEELLDKVAFDIKIPKQVIDSTTNEITWADSINSKKFNDVFVSDNGYATKIEIEYIKRLVGCFQKKNFLIFKN